MKLVQTLNLYLKSKTDSKGVFRYSRGPQFENISYLFFLVLMLLFIFLINQILNLNFLNSAILLFLNLFLLSLIANIQGFEIDTKTNKIRNYDQFLMFRYGQWHCISNLNLIILTKDKLSIKRSLSQGNDTFHYYFVKFCIKDRREQITLFETEKFYDAFKITQNLSKVTGLNFKDFVKGTSS